MTDDAPREDFAAERLPLPTKPLAETMGLGADRGIRCPHCGAAGEWSVWYVRQIEGATRRVRICRRCGLRRVTIEK